MTETEKNILVKSMTEENDENVIDAFLAMAGDTVYKLADPFRRYSKTDVLAEYGGVQARAAAYFLNKRGAEGQTGHSENGINRSYEKADLPESLLREITPICGVIS